MTPFNNRSAGEVRPRSADYLFPRSGAGDVTPPLAAGSPPPSPSSLMWDSNSDTVDTVPLSPQSLSDFDTPQVEQDRRYMSAMMYILLNGHYVSNQMG